MLLQESLDFRVLQGFFDHLEIPLPPLSGIHQHGQIRFRISSISSRLLYHRAARSFANWAAPEFARGQHRSPSFSFRLVTFLVPNPAAFSCRVTFGADLDAVFGHSPSAAQTSWIWFQGSLRDWFTLAFSQLLAIASKQRLIDTVVGSVEYNQSEY